MNLAISNRCLFFCGLLTTVLASSWASGLRAELTIPAHTAYLEPVTSKVRVVKEKGIEGWNDPETKVLWFGQLKQAGSLRASVLVKLREGQSTKLRLTCGGKSKDVEVTGTGKELTMQVSFGDFKISEVGYHEFRLESLNDAGKSAQHSHGPDGWPQLSGQQIDERRLA